ncbi:actin-like protein 7B [Morus bassanus]
MGAKAVERYKALCTVIINTGTGYTRSGLAGDEQPCFMVPRQAGGRPILTHSVVTNWDGLEELWHRVLYLDLGVCPEEVAVLVTDAPLSLAANWEKVANLLFEVFGMLPCSLLAAYSYGGIASVVVGCGDLLLCPAGEALPLSPPGALGLLLGDQRFRCPEALLGPTTLGLPGPRLPEEVARSLCHCGGPLGRPLPYLLLAGGTTLLHGFPRRLAAELGAPPEAAPRCHAAAWLGDSLAASLDAFQGAWVPWDACGEGGPTALHPHCC